MDKSVLHLLFSWKAGIDSRDFRVGLCMLFACLFLTLVSQYGYSAYLESILNLSGEQSFSSHDFVKFENIARPFVPTLAFTSLLGLVLIWSSFVLAMKRTRAMGLSCETGILSGTVNFLFFASIRTIINNYSYYVDDFRTQYAYQHHVPWLAYLLFTLWVLGVVNLILLAAKRNERYPKSGIFGRKLDARNYALQKGNLLACLIVAGIAIGALALSAPGFDPGAYRACLLLFGAVVIAASACDLILMVRRMRDTAWSPRIIAWVYAIYVPAVIALSFAVRHLSPWLVWLFPIITSIMIIFRALLYLLPSAKNVETKVEG